MKMRPKIIGVCLSTIQSEDRFHFIKALNPLAVQQGYRLMVFNSCSDLYERVNSYNDGEISVFRLIPYDLISAMIVFPKFLSNHEIVSGIVTQCRNRNIPVIAIDKHIEGCVSFSFSYADTFYQLCQHIIKDHGARRVYMVAGTKDNEFSDARIAAYRKALEDNDLHFDERFVGYGNFWDGPTLDVLKHWFKTEKLPLPDAIVCANDTMAIAVSNYLQEEGYRVPEDCIVTGFDGIEQASYHYPHLTTCRQDYEDMSRRILDALWAFSAGESYPAENVVGFRIMRSQSCGCVPVSYQNVNHVVGNIFSRMWLCKERQALMCTTQEAISMMKSLEELPEIFINRFVFHTIVFALNDDTFLPPDFGNQHKGKQSFSDRVCVVSHRYCWVPQEPCNIPRKRLIPDLDAMLAHEEPILVCCMHMLDLVLGYCVFQTAITFDEYEKMHTFMSSMDASLGSYHNQVQIREINAELETLYVHDHMTGLYNRRGFYREFAAQRKQHPTGQVLLISADLDGLKIINDTYGHLEGDNAIITVGKALSESAEQGEICARFGGDEFAAAVLISGDAQEYFAAFAQRFKAYLQNYNAASNKPYTVEASIGYSTEMLTMDFDLDRMIKTADDRMYADKVKRKKQRM